MCQKEEASESFIPAVVLRPAYIYTFCLCSDVTSHSTLVTQTQLPKVIFIKAFQCVGQGKEVRAEMPSFSFACILPFFQTRRENTKNTEERKSFPDNTAEQVNAMADIHSRKIKETLKRSSISCIYSSSDDKSCEAIIVTSLTLWLYPSKNKGTLLQMLQKKVVRYPHNWIFS